MPWSLTCFLLLVEYGVVEFGLFEYGVFEYGDVEYETDRARADSDDSPPAPL